MLMVINFPRCGSAEQMCLLNLFIFYLDRIFFFFYSSDYLLCNAVTYIQGETCDKYLLWGGMHNQVFEKIKACQAATLISIRHQNANHLGFRVCQGESRKDFNLF